MTSSGTTTVHDNKLDLDSLVNAIAEEPNPATGVATAIDAATTVTSGIGGVYYSLGEPEFMIVSGLDNLTKEDLLQIISGIPAGESNFTVGFQDQDLHLWQGVVSYDDKPAAALLLFLDEATGFKEEWSSVLSSILSLLKIATINIRSHARHEKLGRNQHEFLRIVSHDLRSPLTSMQGFASMLEAGTVGELNEQQMYFVEKILSGITQMTSLVDNIQDAGRFDPETGFYEMERSQCDLAEMIQNITQNHLVPAEKQELTLSVVLADNVPIINVDTIMVERAITNLVDNAIKYTPNGRDVEVGLRRDDETIIVSVRDNGLGISPDNQKNLFERRVRIRRKEHKRIKGSGLGLFIVRSVARRHGGEAWVESEEGQGATFFISIPLNAENSIISETVS